MERENKTTPKGAYSVLNAEILHLASLEAVGKNLLTWCMSWRISNSLLPQQKQVRKSNLAKSLRQD